MCRSAHGQLLVYISQVMGAEGNFAVAVESGDTADGAARVGLGRACVLHAQDLQMSTIL